jgi:hypothetical protein
MRFNEAQLSGHAAAGEEALASAEHEGADHQPHLVDQVVGEQGLGQLGAADQVQVRAVPVLERAQCAGHVVVQQDQVRPPQRFGERGGSYVPYLIPNWLTPLGLSC